jgi:hypothetical protein
MLIAINVPLKVPERVQPALDQLHKNQQVVERDG